ncbi:MAG: RNA polymerase sigma factor [Gemmatimonadota bacterium]|nr:MAG: RNA polymerase sigma factor [Gemmatimonadota bacterium]
MVTDPRTDEELVESARQSPEGDLRAFDELVRRHEKRVLANCRYLTRSPDDSEDLAQEVFVKAFFGLARFEGRSQFRTWIQRIKANHCLNFLRSSKKGKSFVDVDTPGLDGIDELQVAPMAHRNIEAGETRDVVRAVLESMPDTLRIPLILRDLDDMSYQEIADSLELGLSAVKMRIKRGREMFREIYEQVPVGPDGEAMERE